jgi:preprotein translocase subunit SecA
MISETIEDASGAAFGEHERVKDPAQIAEALAPLEALFLRRSDIKIPAAGFSRDELNGFLEEKAKSVYAAREQEFGADPKTGVPVMRELERVVMLRVVDEYWMEHIDAMEELRDSVRLRAYGNINPVDEYKRDGFDMFEAMVSGIKEEVVRRIFNVRLRKEESLQRRGVAKGLNAVAQNVGGDTAEKKKPVKKEKTPRPNDPCPCGKLRPNGTGLVMKYKDCCGKR